MRENLPDDEAQERNGGGLADVFMIDDLETLKTIADPLRLQIVEQLIDEPLTVKQVAANLGLTPARLYYHVNLLEEHGLIQVVEQRLVSNLVEKVYRATAWEIDVAPSLLHFDTQEGKESLTSMAVTTLDVTREDLLRSLDARAYALAQGAPEHPRRVLVTRQVYRIPESEVEALYRQAQALLEAFEAASVTHGGAAGEDEAADDASHPYAVTVAVYPRFDYPAPSDEEAAR
ncbi:MAG: ArsR/SmtB family transcription factor [Anaerolineae bacterium]